jgi:glycosyltransferase involved in cell wall biosynthesis
MEETLKNKNMHIAIPGVSNFGRDGIATFVYRISNCFSQKITFDYMAYSMPIEISYLDNINKNNGSFVLLTKSCIPFIYKLLYFFSLVRYMKKKQYKICYVNASNAFGMLLQALAAYIAGVPIRIGHSHSSGIDAIGINRVVKFILHILAKPIVPFVLTDFISCSEKATSWMYPEYIIKKKVIIQLNNPINTNIYCYCKDIRENKRSIYKLSNNFIIGNIGRFTYQKNHLFLLKIFKEILEKRKDAFLFLIGDGFLQEKIKKKAKMYNIIDKIIFIEHTSVVNEFMQLFDIFLLPSRFEGLPIVGIEAQSTGLPCFFSDVITKEVNITNNCFFLSLKEKPKFWAEKIIQYSYTYKRKDCSDIVYKAGFDLKMSAKKIENIFIERMNSRKIK